MISIKAIFVSAALCLYPIMALSEAPSLQGEDEANFKEAVQAWLNGEDLPALQSLSDQAQQGNTAAQILLASIASRSSFHAHVTSGMARKDRIALLRKPGGLSGKSWLTEAQNSEPLALALLQSARVGEKAPAIAALVEMGEPQTALLAAESMLRHGEADELVSVLQGLDEKLPKEADILLIWAAYQASQEADGEYSGSAGIARTLSTDDTFRLSEFAWGHLSPRDVWENQEVRDAAIAASDKVRYWSTVRRFAKMCVPLTWITVPPLALVF